MPLSSRHSLHAIVSAGCLAALACLLTGSLWSCATTKSTAIANEPQWQPLFNGKDLTGFYTYLQQQGKNNDPDHIFQVHDGMIHIYKDAPDKTKQNFGYICTNEEHSNFHVRFQYKWGEKKFVPRDKDRRDSGFLYHCVGKDGAGNPWPHSIECQVMENDTGDIFAISTCVSSTIDPAKPKAPQFMEPADGGIPYTKPPKGDSRIARSTMHEIDGWNTVEVIVQGDSGVHIVNGKINNRWTNAMQPDPDNKGAWIPLRHGKLLFQAEGAEVFYRNIEIQVLM